MRATPSRPHRPGLTLIELIVVLMILVALAGMLIPLLPSMLTRAHVSAHTTNVVELAKAVSTYQSLNNGYPDQWDSLTDGTNLVNYLPGGALDPQTPPAGGQAAGQLTGSTPTQAELTALNNAGITKVHLMVKSSGTTPWDGNAFDPTFDYYSGQPNAPTTISTGTNLAFLDPANNAAAMTLLQSNYPSWSTTARYVVLGIGPRCTLIGRGAVTCPVHFGDNPAISPENGYGRFCAIFKVSDTAAPGGINNAVLVGIAPIHDVGLIGLDGEFQNWYQINNGGS
jgi:prepilin-type N-terminal cleavage/methylation domain-containing protein